jgi:hypothetical protein
MTDTGTEDPMRAFTRSLFASDPDETDPDEQQKPGNVVPGEGNNPTGEAHDMHAYLEALFYSDPDA